MKLVQKLSISGWDVSINGSSWLRKNSNCNGSNDTRGGGGEACDGWFFLMATVTWWSWGNRDSWNTHSSMRRFSMKSFVSQMTESHTLSVEHLKSINLRSVEMPKPSAFTYASLRDQSRMNRSKQVNGSSVEAFPMNDHSLEENCLRIRWKNSCSDLPLGNSTCIISTPTLLDASQAITQNRPWCDTFISNSSPSEGVLTNGLPLSVRCNWIALLAWPEMIAAAVRSINRPMTAGFTSFLKAKDRARLLSSDWMRAKALASCSLVGFHSEQSNAHRNDRLSLWAIGGQSPVSKSTEHSFSSSAVLADPCVPLSAAVCRARIFATFPSSQLAADGECCSSG